MAKNLRTLSKQLRNQGYTLLTSFANTYKPGSVVHEERWDRFSMLGMMQSSLTKTGFPAVEGPEAIGIMDFTRNHELTVNAAVDWLGNNITLTGKPASVVDVVARFEGSESYRLDLLNLQDLLNKQEPQFWESALGTHLLTKNTRVVYEVIYARLSFQFRNSGGLGVAVNLAENKSGVKLNAGASYQWKNEATLEMKKPMVVALELAQWDKKRHMFLAV
jgi:hypothetical protein